MSGEPPGWTTVNGVLTNAGRVVDYGRRGQVIKGICRAQGCWRKVTLEPEDLVRRGCGALDMKLVQQFWKCQRFDFCGLDFHPDPPTSPLSLSQLVGLPHVRIRLRCTAGSCKFFRVYTAEELIEGLKARRQGEGSDTDVHALGKVMTSPCKLCKRVNWKSDVLWANANGIGWKRGNQDRYFEDCGFDITKAEWKRRQPR